MCNQAVCLIAAELERRGITTVVVQLLREIAERVRPPRALFVPFLHGYPLDTPGDPKRQHAVLEAALRLFEVGDATPPRLETFLSDVVCFWKRIRVAIYHWNDT